MPGLLTHAVGIAVDSRLHPHLTAISDKDLWVGSRTFEEFAGHDLPNCPGNLRSLDDLGSALFDPRIVAPSIRSFFENTSRCTLQYRGREQKTLTLLHRAYYKLIAQRIGQLAIPPVEPGLVKLQQKNLGLDIDGDGIFDYRIWVRQQQSGQVFYTAALTVVQMPWPGLGAEQRKARYFVISFPMPGFSITAVLAPTNRPDGGMELASSESAGPGHAGTYAIVRHGPTRISYVRLPLREHFAFHRANGKTFHVLHTEYFRQDPLFELDYAISVP